MTSYGGLFGSYAVRCSLGARKEPNGNGTAGCEQNRVRTVPHATHPLSLRVRVRSLCHTHGTEFLVESK